MIHELRTYKPVAGRKAALHSRLRDVVTRLFQRHGMTLVAVWDPIVGRQSDVVYLLRFESLESRETAWRAFLSDPEWLAARNESEADGPLIDTIDSVLLSPTDYSPAA